MAKIVHWGFKDGFRLSQTVGKELATPSQYTPEEFIEAAECALKKHPNEWVIYYTLADNYQKVGFYAEALKATQKCLELRPKDVRSVYALATSYNILTRAAWTNEEDEVSKVFLVLFSETDKADKKYSQAGLDHTGIAVDSAAVQAIRWFEHTLTFKLDTQSRTQVQQDLGTLYQRFPHLRR